MKLTQQQKDKLREAILILEDKSVFNWDETEEGWDYWDNVSYRLNDHLTKSELKLEKCESCGRDLE